MTRHGVDPQYAYELGHARGPGGLVLKVALTATHRQGCRFQCAVILPKKGAAVSSGAALGFVFCRDNDNPLRRTTLQLDTLIMHATRVTRCQQAHVRLQRESGDDTVISHTNLREIQDTVCLRDSGCRMPP